MQQAINSNLSFTIWNHLVDNIFNTALVQVNYETSLAKELKGFANLQYIRQHRIKNGGNHDLDKTYFASTNIVNAVSARTGIQSKVWEVSLNYTHLFKQARYLFPREWGRDPFFTALSRERIEGSGNTNAIVIKTAYAAKKLGLKTSLQGGYIFMPHTKNFALNKYAMPSYKQLNAEVNYTPSTAPAFNFQLLGVYKQQVGSKPLNPSLVFNKVNMLLIHFVVNYNL